MSGSNTGDTNPQVPPIINKFKDTVEKYTPTSHKGVNTIIAVALLVLISVGFAVAFQQIGTGFIDSVEQPVQATIDTDSDDDSANLTIQSMSDNVDEMSIRTDGSLDSGWDGGSSTETFVDVSVGDRASISSLDDGDTVTIIARDNPDNTGVVLNYEHGTS